MTRAIRLHVIVTEADIQRGRRANGSACPVARALRRVGLNPVWVDETEILDGDEGDRIGTPPAVVKRFIARFDDEETLRRDLEPFEFDVTVRVPRVTKRMSTNASTAA